MGTNNFRFYIMLNGQMHQRDFYDTYIHGWVTFMCLGKKKARSVCEAFANAPRGKYPKWRMDETNVIIKFPSVKSWYVYDSCETEDPGYGRYYSYYINENGDVKWQSDDYDYTNGFCELKDLTEDLPAEKNRRGIISDWMFTRFANEHNRGL